MDVRLPWFVEQLQENDSDYFPVVKKVVEQAMSVQALDDKTKFLIVLALDALKGAEQGVQVVARHAREAGASEQEIRETLRLAYFVSGMDVIKASCNAFKE